MCYALSNVYQLINNSALAEHAVTALTLGICESSFNIIKFFKPGESNFISYLSFPLMYIEIWRLGRGKGSTRISINSPACIQDQRMPGASVQVRPSRS